MIDRALERNVVPLQVGYEDNLGFLMSSIAQSQAEIVTEGVFLRNPVLKEIYDRQSFEKLFYPIYIGHEDSFVF